MTKTAILVDRIGKQYRLGQQVSSYRTLRETLVESFSSRGRENGRNPASPESIWALKDVSFEVKQGQVLGVVGRNGAGKSTLLKILSRVTEPTEGIAEIHGRVGSLLEVGTGFHPELTGRENIFLNGAILGMKKNEIESKFDEIVSFAEVEKFIDTPVKRFSSGMYLRLAFAVAAHLEPEILVVDEVLAVGDAEFQRKCLGKMSDVAKEGRTVMFVSHNMSAILRLTEETLVIDKGYLLMRAPTNEAVDFYLSRGLTQEGQRTWHPDEIPAIAAPFKPLMIRLVNKKGHVIDTARTIEDFYIEMEYQLSRAIKGLRVGIYIITSRGEFVFTSFDTDDAVVFNAHAVREKGHYVSRCKIPSNLLNGGRFIVGCNASSYRIKTYFHDEQALVFNVDASGAAGMQWPELRLGPVRPALNWEIRKREHGDES
ncbi:MAG: ABC transporter ATP-binding protein [Chloroflexi bacterium]|nr:ABC transporter ATP-binding protein [Chloroflexota bacterium]